MASAYFFNLISITPFNLPNSHSNTNSIPTAKIVHSSESMKVPTSVGKFVILIPNESHQDWSDEKFKLNTDKNSYYLHTILIVPNGYLSLPFYMLTPLGILLILIPLNYRIALGVVYNIDQLDYTSSSKLIVLLPQELTIDKSYDTEEAKITVLENETSSGNLILGGFYTPTNQVENTEDNDGVSHPGSVQYYKEALKQGGI